MGIVNSDDDHAILTFSVSHLWLIPTCGLSLLVCSAVFFFSGVRLL